MFSVHCPAHGAEVLLTADQIEGLEHRHDGILVRWRCWCGHAGASLTGRAAGRRLRVA